MKKMHIVNPPLLSNSNYICKNYLNEPYLKKLRIAKFLYDFSSFPRDYRWYI